MDITFAPNGILQINGARIIHRNFAGEGSMYNRAGDRNFSLVIPSQEIADELVAQGWNVKVKPPREDGDEPFFYMPVKVKFNFRGPNVYVRSGMAYNKIEEPQVSMLDELDIEHVDLDIRPYDWEMQGKTGRTAYLQNIRVTQRVDRFAEDYNTGREPF